MITKEQYFYFRQLDDFKHFTIEQFDHIVSHIKHRTALKNHTLFFEGDYREKLFLIQSGHVKIEQSDASGSFIYTDLDKIQFFLMEVSFWMMITIFQQ